MCRLLVAPMLMLLFMSASPAPERAAPFTVALLDGRIIRSEDLAGRLVILNFWAIWCVPCRRELAEMDAFARRQGNDRVVIFAIDVDKARAPARLKAQADAMGIPIAKTLPRGAEAYHPIRNAVPTTYIIDAHGRLALAKAGAFAVGEFDRLASGLIPREY
ncbi:TlpA disulfide reductase family protein [Sphingomonas sp.]|uniref:TlpA disulfide reductase family protein n=1 Tax=Sphingomonas sp. TaxID=28214 RepID=UPI000DB8B4D4|nr:TlpA disulfide reductase family protein [Sphingomonas sp.]PZU10134.1 MAG: TlpA family protein disulfide reductase [Sphingomonas sp.]